jgi:release factor glutamine methyltransferase
MGNSSENQNLWTVKDVLEWTAGYFKSKGISTARLDAEVLLAHSLEVDRLHLYLNLDRPLIPSERTGYRELIQRRARREPVARIIGTKEFWSIPFRAVPGVLIPRPDTETLVEAVLDEIKDRSEPNILEIGTGSGAIAVAVIKDNPDAVIVATDIDSLALRTARLNAEDAGVADSLKFVRMDLFESLRPGTVFDVICSNPPYIPSDDIANLEPEVRDHEPRRALDGGPEGLDVIGRLIRRAGDFLTKDGALILEIGDGQAGAVGEIFAQTEGFTSIRMYHDLASIARVVKAKKCSADSEHSTG